MLNNISMNWFLKQNRHLNTICRKFSRSCSGTLISIISVAGSVELQFASIFWFVNGWSRCDYLVYILQMFKFCPKDSFMLKFCGLFFFPFGLFVAMGYVDGLSVNWSLCYGRIVSVTPSCQGMLRLRLSRQLLPEQLVKDEVNMKRGSLWKMERLKQV